MSKVYTGTIKCDYCGSEKPMQSENPHSSTYGYHNIRDFYHDPREWISNLYKSKDFCCMTCAGRWFIVNDPNRSNDEINVVVSTVTHGPWGELLGPEKPKKFLGLF